MKPEYSNNRQMGSRGQGNNPMTGKGNKMQYRGEYSSFPDLDIALIIRRLLAGLWRLFVALKFHIHQFVFGSRGGYRLPWFRIGLAVLTLFILTKKDVQFSINMKAPLAGFMGGNENANDASVDQLGVAQTISFKESSAVPKAIHLPDDEIIKGYINRFDRVARAEMEKFGIPASIQIGQAILESRAGKSPSARDHNNHFGAPLGGKAFDSAWANWRAHSLLIVQEHNELLELGQSYKKWAKGLVKAGLGQGKNYDQRLIDIIEKFQLYNLDETL